MSTSVGRGLRVDEDVRLAYPSERLREGDFDLGIDARLRSGTVLYAGSRIGDRLQTGHHVVVREQVVVGDDVSIWNNTVVDYGSTIGNGVKIHANCYVAQYSTIEDGAFLAPGVTFANDLYPGFEISAGHLQGPVIRQGARVGANVTILPFVVVGAGAMVGAGSVVTRDVPAHSLVYGTPAVVRGALPDREEVDRRIALLSSGSRPGGDGRADQVGMQGSPPRGMRR